jgi:peroxiredoxin
MWLRGLKAVLRGGVGIPVGDVWQMPGTFVIDREGTIRFAHYPSSSVEWPSNGELLRLLDSIAAA